MASEASLWSGPKGKRSADLLIAFVLIALLFSFGEVSAQEVRSGWEVVDSGTEENLYTAEYLDGEIWAFGSGGTMIRSIDEGRTWSESGISVSQDLTSSDSSYKSIIVAGNSGTVLLMNEGVWIDISSDQFGDIKDVALTGNDSFVVIEQDEVWTCTVTVEWDTECDSAIEGEGINYLSVSFLDSENGIISGESGAIIASSDGGISWEYRDAPSEVSTKAIIDVEYYSTIRAYAISEEGHLLK